MNSRLIGYYGQYEDNEEVKELDPRATSCDYMNEFDFNKYHQINSNNPQKINTEYIDFQEGKNSHTFYDNTHLKNYITEPHIAKDLTTLSTLVLSGAGLLDDLIRGMLFNQKSERSIKFQVTKKDNGQQVIELWSTESNAYDSPAWSTTAPSHILKNYETDENGRITIGDKGAYRVMQHGFISMAGVALITSKEQDSFVGVLQNAVEIKTVMQGSYVNHRKVISRTGILGGMTNLCVIIVDTTGKEIQRVTFNENLHVLDDNGYRLQFQQLTESVIRFIIDFVSGTTSGTLTPMDGGFVVEGCNSRFTYENNSSQNKPRGDRIQNPVRPRIHNHDLLYIIDEKISVNAVFPNSVNVQIASKFLEYGPVFSVSRPAVVVLFIKDETMAKCILHILECIGCRTYHHNYILDCVGWTDSFSIEDRGKYINKLERNKTNVANLLNKLS